MEGIDTKEEIGDNPVSQIWLQARLNELNLAWTGAKNTIRYAIECAEEGDVDDCIQQLKQLIGED